MNVVNVLYCNVWGDSVIIVFFVFDKMCNDEFDS